MAPLRPSLRVLLALACGLALTGLAFQVAWLSDDAFITLRHLQQLAAGNGPVFNIGERVQGYTHPLWFWLLAALQALGATPWRASLLLGLLLSGLTAAGWSGLFLHRERGAPSGLALALGLSVLLATSEVWLSFSTSGLENPLSHLLLVAVAWELDRRGFERPWLLALLWALLGLNRMDMAAAALPSALLLARELKTPKRWLQASLGAVPMLLWLGFAAAYYGDPLPNTAHAKVGIFPSTGAAIGQGLTYLLDWLRHEPAAATLSLAGVGLGLHFLRGKPTWALPLGGLGHLLYVVWVGGDFMRGRFWLVLMVLGLSSLGLAVSEIWAARPESRRWTGALLVLTALSSLLPKPPETGQVPESGIVNERAFYPQQAWSVIAREGIQPTVVDRPTLELLGAYVERCGPTTVHAPMPGSIAFLSPVELSVVDTLGLTDREIAALPAEHLIPEAARVGHPFKTIPYSLLAQKGDLAILEGWLPAVAAMDCSLRDKPTAYVDAPGEWSPPGSTLPMP